MAKTYYGYAERDADSQLDWSKIGKDFSDMLSKEASDREAMKDKLETETTSSLDVMKSTPMGNHEGVNTWALDYSSEAQQQLLMLNRELKAGRLMPKDYTKQRERLTSGTQGLYDVVKGYQTEYADNMKRITDGTAGGFQSKMLESLESMSNFTEYKPIINSATGEVMVAKRLRDKDGNLTAEISDDPNDIASVNILLGRITQKYDKYDLTKNAYELGKRYGSYKKVIGKGKYATIEDKRLFDKFEESLRSEVQGRLTNHYQASSILDDYLQFNPDTNKEFYYTADKNDKSPDAIHYSYEGSGQQPTFNLSPKQMELAEEAYVSAVKATLSRDEVYKAPVPKRALSVAEMTQKEQKAAYSRLFTLTTEFVNNPTDELVATINELGRGVIDIKDGKVNLIGADGAVRDELDLNKKGGFGKRQISAQKLQELIFMSQVPDAQVGLASNVYQQLIKGAPTDIGSGMTRGTYKSTITKPKTEKEKQEMSFTEKAQYTLHLKDYTNAKKERDKYTTGEYKGHSDAPEKAAKYEEEMNRAMGEMNKFSPSGSAAGDRILEIN